MDLSKILVVSGKPGLFQLVSQTKTGILIESLLDGKRIPAFSNDKISSLEEISILCTDEDTPLKKVFQTIFEQEEQKAIENIKSLSPKELTERFKGYVPNYANEKVYTSDMKKVFSWYNLLLDKNLIDLNEEKKSEEA